MKTLLAVLILLGPPVGAEVLGRARNAERMVEHMVFVLNSTLANFVYPNDKTRILAENDFTAAHAARACGAMGTLTQHFHELKRRATSQADRSVPSQVQLLEMHDRHAKTARELANAFCGAEPRDNVPVARPSNTIVVQLVKMRNDLRQSLSQPFSFQDFSRSNPVAFANRARQLQESLKLFTQTSGPLATQDHARVCLILGVHAVTLGLARSSLDDHKIDAGRTSVSRCDEVSDRMHEDAKALLAGFCAFENTQTKLTAGTVDAALMRALSAVATSTTFFQNNCKSAG